jgi:two-component system, OmpR family, sensor histidine kinase QseC
VTLQRRVLLLVLLSAPLVWLGALLFSIDRARYEINELFDTELIRLARQVQSTLPLASLDAIEIPQVATIDQAAQGDAELEDLAIAVWNREGKLLLVDREGVKLPHRPDASGFSDVAIGSAGWRVYYLQAASREWLIAVGQDQHERDELVWNLMAGQVLPWVLTLPVLLLVMYGAVRRALRPLHTLTAELDRRAPGDLAPLHEAGVPQDLLPLVKSMNTLLMRIDRTMEHERRFTADAAHELRSPLAALQAQWEAAELQAGAEAPTAVTRDKIGASLERMSRLVTQLLALSRLDLPAATATHAAIDWPAVVEQVFSELLPLADRRHIELACEWPSAGVAALPLRAEPSLISALLRNLLDNALRHGPPGSTVTLRMQPDAIEVQDEGPGVPEPELARLGDRFYRPPGADEAGSGLGLSIVRRIAELHGLAVGWANREDHSGFRVRLTRA